MLGSVRSLGFSETARSRPGHDKACGGLNRLLPSSIFAGRYVDDVMKRSTESAQAREADVEADVRHGSVGLAQHEHRSLDTPPLEIAVRRLSECRFEGPDEVRFGNAGDPRQVRDVERLRVLAVHGVSCPEHAAVDLLDRPTHRPITCRDYPGVSQMASWGEFEAAEPEFASRVRALMTGR